MNALVAGATMILGAFLGTVLLTWLLRSWLQQRHIVDTPNERSLHAGHTVTGGGIAVAVVLVVAWWYAGTIGHGISPAILVPVVGLSLAGLVDDVRNLDWLAKLLLQLAAALLFVVLHGGFERLELFGAVLSGPLPSGLFSVLWLVALVNIYNFMDGIDGLAGGYGALCALTLGVWFGLGGALGLSLYAYAVMAACLGFVVWNWAPARIFLGDTGSMLLGGVLAALAIMGQRELDIPLGAFVLLYAVFIGDTAFTLIRRLRRGEKIWRAHREHLYQRAVRSGLSHAVVTGAVLGVSAIMCVLASLEMSRAEPRFLWLVLCLLLLWWVMMRVRYREGISKSCE